MAKTVIKEGDRVNVSGEVYYGGKWYRVASEGTVLAVHTKSMLVTLDEIDGDGHATVIVRKKYIRKPRKEVGFTLSQFRTYILNRLCNIVLMDNKYVIFGDTQILQQIVPPEIQTEKEAIAYIYKNQLFDELEQLIM